MKQIRRTGDVVLVTGLERTLTYRPRRVTLDDGTWVAHESRGGSMSSVWAVDLGDRFVEVVHLGTGPAGGELVVVVPDASTLLIGDLWTAAPSAVPPEWPATIDLLLGMTTPTSTIIATDGPVERETLADFHQQLLGIVHG